MTHPKPDERLQIVEERLHVDKRTIETDRVQVRTVVDDHQIVLNDTVERGVLDVERIPFDIEVAEAPPLREDGDVVIISVVEERVELVKRLFLVEELRVRRTSITDTVAIPAVARRMRAEIIRSDAPSTAEEQ